MRYNNLGVDFMAVFDVPLITNGLIIEKKTISHASDMPEMHSHICHELYFLFSGKRRYCVGHNIFDVAPGNLVIIPKTELHKTSVLEGEGYERFVLYFADDTIEELKMNLGEDAVSEFLSCGCLVLPSEISKKIEANLEEILLESKRNDSVSHKLKLNLFQNIILYALRYGKIKDKETNEASDKIQEVARFISSNFYREITLSECARKAFMEETYFSKKFRQLTGFGFKEYLIGVRIKAAENLLSNSDLSICEISEKCGFSSSNYFGDIFKKIKGCSPSEWRKNFSD